MTGDEETLSKINKQIGRILNVKTFLISKEAEVMLIIFPTHVLKVKGCSTRMSTESPPAITCKNVFIQLVFSFQFTCSFSLAIM